MLWRHMGTVRRIAVPGRNRGVEGVGLSALCALQCLWGLGVTGRGVGVVAGVWAGVRMLP